ncbi:hypothetical protein [Bacillus dakarensis]|uniref:hypothetical protein n=1 Tax=Robertmurraya dakarensis TaxID=1926278 RepID=UPI0012B6AA0E|nr:hypothetical protein [Bacillus dakarensis]
MNFLVIGALLVIILYSFGFAVTLWREKNKIGSIAVNFLCLLMAVLPFFSYFK